MSRRNHIPFKSIPLAQLFVDPAVQRDETKFVQYLVENWNEDAVGTPEVSQRGSDGFYHVMEGQHRVAAMKQMFPSSRAVWCKVSEGLTRREEADRFLGLNKRQTIGTFDKFRVRIAAGDHDAVAVAQIIDECGWKLASGQYDHAFAAVTAAETVYTGKRFRLKERQPESLRWALTVPVEAWGYSPLGVQGVLVEALGSMHILHGERIDTQSFVKKLAGKLPNNIIAQGRASADALRTTVPTGTLDVLVRIYNTGRRSGAL